MFSVIYIPDFALQAAVRTDPELYSRPVALIGEPQATIFQLTAAARNAGVELGMTPTQAMARCGHILIKTRSIAQEKAANEALLQCVFCFSPAIEATAPGVCTLDLKGLRNAGDTEFSGKIIRALAQLHLQAQVGVAENPLLAFHAARAAQPFLAVKERRDFLAPLPLETIDPRPAISEILKKWGISTLGQFTALGRDQISERLGPEALELFDRACADATRPLKLVAPSETFEEAIDFEHEIESLEPLLFILRRFLEQISRRLELAYWVAESIQLRLLLTDGSHYERLFKIPAPTRDIDTLFRMVHTHLENLRTDYSIVGVHLSARPCHREDHQFGLFETAFRDPNHFYETLARLTALVGADRVGVATLECTHRPDAFHLEMPEIIGTAPSPPLDAFSGIVAQASKPAVSQVSNLRARRKFPRVGTAVRHADLEVGDTAGLEACATLNTYPPWGESLPGGRMRGRRRPTNELIDRNQEPRTKNQEPRTRFGLSLRRFRPHLPVEVHVEQQRPVYLKSSSYKGRIARAEGPWRNSGDWWDTHHWQREEWDVQTGAGILFRVCQQGDQWFLEGMYD